VNPFAAFGETLAWSGTRAEMRVPRTAVPELLRAAAGLAIDDLTIEPLSLEEAFLEHYR
jgi:hypothetical protein